MGKGDIPKETFEDSCNLCIQFLRGIARNKLRICSTKGSGGGVTKAEIGNLLDNLRIGILSTLSTQMDTSQVKQKQLELDRTMAIFCSKCRKKHLERERPLNSIEECAICELNHATSSCPSLPGLKAIFQGTGEEQSNCTSWDPRSHGSLSHRWRIKGCTQIHLSISIIAI